MSDIIINDIDPINQYVATALQTNFVYDYPIREASYLKVYATAPGSPPDDTAQLLILNVDYTVTGVGSQAGGEIVLTTGVVENTRITIYRDMPLERLQNFVNDSDYDVDTLNMNFNDQLMMMQQLRGEINKVITKYQRTGLIDSINNKLPILEENQFWKRTSLGIEGVELEEDPGWSSLRSELANKQTGTDGSRLIGHYSSVAGETTVHSELERVQEASYGVDSGTPNVIKVALSPVPVAYYAGYTVHAKIANTVTGATTLEVNSLGTKSVVALINGALIALTSSSAIAGMIGIFVYDATLGVFQLLNPNPSASEGVIGEIRLGYFTATEVPSGWFFFYNGTIGDATSGATRRANADTQNLFVHLWNKYSFPSGNVYCPVVGILGASAIDDFNAHKQLTLPFLNYRSLCIAGYDYLSTSNFIDACMTQGAPQHTLTVAEMPTHSHDIDIASSGTPTAFHLEDFSTDAAIRVAGIVKPIGGSQPHNILSPRIGINAMMKL